MHTQAPAARENVGDDEGPVTVEEYRAASSSDEIMGLIGRLGAQQVSGSKIRELHTDACPERTESSDRKLAAVLEGVLEFHRAGRLAKTSSASDDHGLT